MLIMRRLNCSHAHSSLSQRPNIYVRSTCERKLIFYSPSDAGWQWRASNCRWSTGWHCIVERKAVYTHRYYNTLWQLNRLFASLLFPSQDLRACTLKWLTTSAGFASTRASLSWVVERSINNTFCTWKFLSNYLIPSEEVWNYRGQKQMHGLISVIIRLLFGLQGSTLAQSVSSLRFWLKQK